MAKRSDLLKIINSQNADIGALTDEELSARLDALQGIGTADSEGINQSHLKNDVKAELQNKYGLDPRQAESASAAISDHLAKFENNPNNPGLGNILNNVQFDSATADKLRNVLNDQNFVNKYSESIAKGRYSVGGELPDDIAGQAKLIQELQAQRGFVKDQNMTLEQFYANEPAALEAERSKFFAGQRARAKDYVANEYAPYVVEQLGARGLADSGAVGDEIARKYGSIQSTIEQEQTVQRDADLQFFSDMAFKSTYQNLINARTDIRGQLDFQSTSNRQKQNQDFAARESSIDRSFNADLFRNQNEQALKGYQTQITKKNEAQDDAFKQDLIKTGIGTAANVALMGTIG